MNFKVLHKILFLTLCLISIKAYSTEFDVNQKIFKDFSSTNFLSFSEVIKDKSFVVLFQPNCSSCKKQIKDLDCLKDIANEVLLIGSFGTIKNVRRSYMKKNSTFKGFYIGSEQVTGLGFESGVTPQSIYYSKERSLHFMGYKSCKKIAEKIKELHGNS